MIPHLLEHNILEEGERQQTNQPTNPVFLVNNNCHRENNTICAREWARDGSMKKSEVVGVRVHFSF